MNWKQLHDLRRHLRRLDDTLESWMGPDTVPTAVDDAATAIQELFGDPPDLVHRVVYGADGQEMHVLYFDAAVTDLVALEGLLDRLMAFGQESWDPNRLPVGGVQPRRMLHQVATDLISGRIAIGTSMWSDWWVADLGAIPHRSIEEPSNAKVLHGPHTGFVESLDINLLLLRGYLRTPSLRVQSLTIGELSQQPVALVFVEGWAATAVVEKVEAQILRLRVDGITDTAQIAEQVTPSRLLPTLQLSERPDFVANALRQGRVAVLLDGSPSALLAPAVLAHFMTVSGDYYQPALSASFVRLLRWFALQLAILMPAVYIGILTINPSLIPLPLALSVIHSRINIPFPAIIETVIMLGIFDLVQEASLQMPGPLGQTVSIVGALVVGQSAIAAGIVSAPTVIAVALAFLAGFLIPDSNLQFTVRLLRYPFLAIAGVFGLIGIISATVMVLALGSSLQSYGTPYLAPLAPMRPTALKDAVIRAPTSWRGPRFPGRRTAGRP